ncbi:hypothetical protein [Guyparkeria halopsychrophila]|uniref:hypothetical protein n=1 Tax=Guyparkeria halopsychrophila TaxID=3139421 RepID=UPI0037C74A47
MKSRWINAGGALQAAAFGVTLALLGGCALIGNGPTGDQRTVIVYPGGDTSLDPVIVPASHLPPAGKCRIWHLALDPEDQPEPRNCRERGHDVPEGAVLVRG